MSGATGNPPHALKHGGYRVFVTGGRAYPHREIVFSALDRIDRKYGVVCVIHGNCMQPDESGRWKISGADRWADEWAAERGKPCARFEITRGEWKALGKIAGPLRNTRAIEKGVPDICCHLPGGTGTADAVRQCRERGILTWDPISNEVL